MEVYAAKLCSENACDIREVSEVDDVAQGSEPGASRYSVLIPTDSYDDFAKFAGSSCADTAYDDHRRSHGTIEQLKDDTDSVIHNSNSERTVADDSCLRKERLKPPEPIFARIDTPTSLSEDDIERHRLSTASTFSSQPDNDTQQIAVQIPRYLLRYFVVKSRSKSRSYSRIKQNRELDF